MLLIPPRVIAFIISSRLYPNNVVAPPKSVIDVRFDAVSYCHATERVTPCQMLVSGFATRLVRRSRTWYAELSRKHLGDALPANTRQLISQIALPATSALTVSALS